MVYFCGEIVNKREDVAENLFELMLLVEVNKVLFELLGQDKGVGPVLDTGVGKMLKKFPDSDHQSLNDAVFRNRYFPRWSPILPPSSYLPTRRPKP